MTDSEEHLIKRKWQKKNPRDWQAICIDWIKIPNPHHWSRESNDSRRISHQSATTSLQSIDIPQNQSTFELEPFKKRWITWSTHHRDKAYHDKNMILIKWTKVLIRGFQFITCSLRSTFIVRFFATIQKTCRPIINWTVNLLEKSQTRHWKWHSKDKPENLWLIWRKCLHEWISHPRQCLQHLVV